MDDGMALDGGAAAAAVPLRLSVAWRALGPSGPEPEVGRERPVDAGDRPVADAAIPLAPDAPIAPREVAAPRVGRVRAARWGRPPRAMAVLLTLPMLALLAAPLLIGQEITAPSWMRHRVEAEASRLLGGGSIDVGAITLLVGTDLHPRLRLLDASIRDGGGRLLAHVPELAATVSPRGLLDGRVLVQAISIQGAELALTRAADGQVDLVVQAGAAPGDGPGPGAMVGRARGLASIPDQIERLFDRPALEALRRVDVVGLVVNYDDARAGREWTLDGGALRLDLTRAEARLSGEVSLLSGRGFVTQAHLDYRSPRHALSAEIGVTLTDVAATDIATQSPALAWLGVVDAPISVGLRVRLDEAGRLGPMHAALKIAGGAIRPSNGAPPVAFDVARAYLSYDPAASSIDFERLEVRSDWGSVLAGGRAYLREDVDGMPRALLGQFDLREAALSPPGLLDRPLLLSEASVALRLRLDPFSVEVVQASAVDGGDPGGVPGLGRILAKGRVGATPGGWRAAIDATVPQATRDRLLSLWPVAWRPTLRAWMSRNLTAGRFSDATVALRVEPGAPLRLAASTRFDGAAFRPLATHPPIEGASGRLSWDTGALSVALEAGRMAAPEGGSVDLAGTSLTMPAGGGLRPPARVDLVASGPITAALSLLDQAPLAVMTSAGLPVDVAEGRASATGTVDIRLGAMTPDELRYDVAADLSDVATDRLVPGFALTADALRVQATEAGVEIAGPVRLDGIAAEGIWRQARAEPGRSRVEADVTITPEALATLGIALPEGVVAGSGRGRFTLDLASGRAPAFTFGSTLTGLRLRLPELGWSKGAEAAGELQVTGRLGAPVAIDRLAFSAPDLSAEGDVTLTADGALDRLDLDRLRVGGWLDAPVTLVGRGPATPAIEVRGGTLDLGASTFGLAGGGSGGAGTGSGGPISVALDRLQVTDGIALTDLRAELSTVSGLEGTFSGLVNGGPAVTGRVAPQAGRVGARVQGDDAGAVMRAADLFTKADGGTLDLLLLPVGEASYDGEAYITGLQVKDAPVLASLLNAVSVVGLLQQLGGQGIAFEQVSASFRIDPSRITVSRSSAIGAGLGLSMDGTFDIDRHLMDFQGVLSPLYLINGIGQIFSRPGEGLIGFNYTLSGSPDAPQVGVNPLSALTPGMFRDIFRRSPPPGQ